MTINQDKIKKLGQIFTPSHIVKIILDKVGYQGHFVLKKHIMENSCGQGAFLTEIVIRYIECALKSKLSNEQIKDDLQKYIHGIELEKDNYNKCIYNLDSIAFSYGISNVKWDIINADAMDVNEYNGKMDFVVGNPPYVRVHNLGESYAKVRDFKFCKSGMTDLYIVFYEIGFNMLSPNGKLAYITPNSCYNSVAALDFRKYIVENKRLFAIIDLGHYQPFNNVITYTTIMCFDNNNVHDSVEFSRFNKFGVVQYINTINYDELMINNNFLLTRDNKEILRILSFKPTKKYVEVKNAFATLMDNFFIKEDFDFDENVIDIIKASTGEWKKCFYPYDNEGKTIELKNFKSKKLLKYIEANEKGLKNRSLEKNSQWYAFGRSQGIKDVYKYKISINPIVKDLSTIKLNEVAAGCGVYSGLYILTKYSFEYIENIIFTDTFIEYVSALNKCKSGGYFAFSSKDLALYLNYQISQKEKDNDK